MKVLLLFLLLGVLGLSCFVAGILVLYGHGWALIAAAPSFISAAAFLRRGMTDG